jgi:hypothetical protein
MPWVKEQSEHRSTTAVNMWTLGRERSFEARLRLYEDVERLEQLAVLVQIEHAWRLPELFVRPGDRARCAHLFVRLRREHTAQAKSVHPVDRDVTQGCERVVAPCGEIVFLREDESLDKVRPREPIEASESKGSQRRVNQRLRDAEHGGPLVNAKRSGARPCGCATCASVNVPAEGSGDAYSARSSHAYIASCKHQLGTRSGCTAPSAIPCARR